MDTLARYRKVIKQVLTDYAHFGDPTEGVRTELIFDEKQDHYQWGEVGWENDRRIEGVVVHIDIIEGKIWIQHDGTEHGVARELEALGVPRHDIVLGFHAPYRRQYTGYAVA